MQKSILPFLCCNLAFFWLLGCATYQPAKGYEPLLLQDKTITNPFFSDPAKDYLYKANVEVYGNSISGILVIKKVADQVHRVVLTTEFGNTLLDLELAPGHFQVHSAVAELNRRLLLKTLEKDLRLLLKEQFVVEEAYQKEGVRLYKSVQGNARHYVVLNGEKFAHIIAASKTKQKIKVSFTTENNIFAQDIRIEHYNIPLSIQLSHFKEN